MVTKRSPLNDRVAALHRLATPDTRGQTVDQRARDNLAQWYRSGTQKPTVIAVRPGFIRRYPALTDDELRGLDIRDRPQTKLRYPPPLAQLVSRPRGEGLRLALTLLFLAQTGRRDFLAADGRLDIGIERGEAPLGLVDLIGIPAAHSLSIGEKTQASTRESNRREQILAAFNLLSSKGIGMVELRNPAGSRARFDDAHLRYESGDRAGLPLRYRRPHSSDVTVDIPVDFFLNGWIHTLNKREIAMWLMLRSEMQMLSSAPPADEFPITVAGYTRLTRYDLALGVYETNPALTAYGLIEARRDPRRRADGTAEANQRNLPPNAFKLTDDGLTSDALITVTRHAVAAASRAKRP